MGEGRIGKSLEKKAGILTDRVLKLSSLRKIAGFAILTDWAWDESCCSWWLRQSQIPFSTCYTECVRLQAFGNPSRQQMRAVSSQGGWGTVFWGKAVSSFQQSLLHTNTEAADLIGALLCLAQTFSVSQMSLIQLKAAHDCPQYPKRVKRPGPPLCSPNFPLTFLGHRVGTVSASENHSLGWHSSGPLLGTWFCLETTYKP